MVGIIHLNEHTCADSVFCIVSNKFRREQGLIRLAEVPIRPTVNCGRNNDVLFTFLHGWMSLPCTEDPTLPASESEQGMYLRPCESVRHCCCVSIPSTVILGSECRLHFRVTADVFARGRDRAGRTFMHLPTHETCWIGQCSGPGGNDRGKASDPEAISAGNAGA